MRTQVSAAAVTAASLMVLSLVPAFAGDSLYGKVTTVKSGEAVVLDYGAGKYDIRIVGIDAPREGQPGAKEASDFLRTLVLGKNARMRLERRAEDGTMVARLFTDDPVQGVRDVGVELVRAGLVRRQAQYSDKYGELAAAESEARTARRGLWATSR